VILSAVAIENIRREAPMFALYRATGRMVLATAATGGVFVSMPDVLHAIAARVRALMTEESVFDVVSRAHMCGPIIHAGEVLGALDTGILV
jgi:hypothetical protein